jgi:BlaI family transcriptional regulator, penicillinase repressor
MKKLTKEEERIMHEIWTKKKVFVREIIEGFNKPKPPYSTISSIVRILEKKGFVGHHAYGKTHQYYPLISKSKYRSFEAKELLSKYFDGSATALISYFAKQEKTDVEALKQLINELEKKQNQ